MTESVVAYSNESGSAAAGRALGLELRELLPGAPPNVVILFASSSYEYEVLLEALLAASGTEILVGCSSAGEFINQRRGEHSASAVALRSDDLRFSAGLGRRLRDDLEGAAQSLASSFRAVGTESSRFHSALVLTDALAGRTDELIHQLNMLTGGDYQFFGGGAGDDARFEQTHVFCGTEAVSDAAVALEIISTKPLGLGVQHGWHPTGKPLRVTEAAGMRVISLNAAPAVEAFQEHAEATGQSFDPSDPLPFFLHNVIGIDTGGGYKLRVPLAIEPDGAITCASDVPQGAVISFMRTTNTSAADAAERAVSSALDQMDGNTPAVALFFDCVATRLRLGEEFGTEMQTLENSLNAAQYVGCNTYGQIARASGQFSGFHNCTAVVCLIPQ